MGSVGSRPSALRSSEVTRFFLQSGNQRFRLRHVISCRTHLLVWPVVPATIFTESCVEEIFWVKKIGEGNPFLSLSLFCFVLFFFFFLGHFHVIDRRSRREEEEESAKKKHQQWRREKEPFRSDEKRERIIK